MFYIKHINMKYELIYMYIYTLWQMLFSSNHLHYFLIFPSTHNCYKKKIKKIWSILYNFNNKLFKNYYKKQWRPSTSVLLDGYYYFKLKLFFFSFLKNLLWLMLHGCFETINGLFLYNPNYYVNDIKFWSMISINVLKKVIYHYNIRQSSRISKQHI